jgi:hypothetical protein
MATMSLTANVEAVRHFQSLLHPSHRRAARGFLGSSFTLAEGRVLYEIAQHEQPTASRRSAGSSAWTPAI